jgi:hypothetical protein
MMNWSSSKQLQRGHEPFAAAMLPEDSYIVTEVVPG